MAVTETTIRVMVVDDHPLVGEALDPSLRRSGMELVATATDGHAALRILGTERPDVLLVDLSMPGMDGLTFAGRVKDMAQPIPVVAISAADSPATVRAAIAAGCTGFISKMASSTEIPGVLQRAVAGRPAFDSHTAASLAELGLIGGDRIPQALTERELQILRLAANGLSNAEIATHVGVAAATVKNQVHSMLVKMGVSDRTAAVAAALRQGIIS